MSLDALTRMVSGPVGRPALEKLQELAKKAEGVIFDLNTGFGRSTIAMSMVTDTAIVSVDTHRHFQSVPEDTSSLFLANLRSFAKGHVAPIIGSPFLLPDLHKRRSSDLIVIQVYPQDGDLERNLDLLVDIAGHLAKKDATIVLLSPGPNYAAFDSFVESTEKLKLKEQLNGIAVFEFDPELENDRTRSNSGRGDKIRQSDGETEPSTEEDPKEPPSSDATKPGSSSKKTVKSRRAKGFGGDS